MTNHVLSRLKHIAQYDWAGNSVETWTGSADTLFAAASVLRRTREAARVAPATRSRMMLSRTL